MTFAGFASSPLILIAVVGAFGPTLIGLAQSKISNPAYESSHMKSARIVITKSKRTLDLYDGSGLIKSYKMVLGFTPVGDKQVEGDGRTPEGNFYVFTKNAESRFHLSLGISYPASQDAERGLENKLITAGEGDSIRKAIAEKAMPPQKTALGGEIYIHGGGIRSDWTDGCVALKDEEIRQLFDAVPIGTRVTIKP